VSVGSYLHVIRKIVLFANSSEFDYFVVYNKTSGVILSMITLQKCQESKNVSVGGFRFDSSSLSAVPDKNQGQLNITSSPYLNSILSNGWLNAFYVTSQGELAPRQGITFSGQQAYYNGQPITNGTILGINP
jgi:hypothetical protein